MQLILLALQVLQQGEKISMDRTHSMVTVKMFQEYFIWDNAMCLLYYYQTFYKRPKFSKQFYWRPIVINLRLSHNNKIVDVQSQLKLKI